MEVMPAEAVAVMVVMDAVDSRSSRWQRLWTQNEIRDRGKAQMKVLMIALYMFVVRVRGCQ